MDPAVLAARVVARPVFLPFDPFKQGIVGWKDSVGEQVARPLPAIGIARDRAPWRTRELAFAGKEFLIDGAGEPAVAFLLSRRLDDPELLLVLGPGHRQV